ncbi:MAG TPA: hypothetical protein VMB80_00805 [Candidatus Acidoferrum sp.]|nr:hypothetical protein [Candidatus Acidoferrum sp.]
MLNVIFSLDYEIHGNGEGCPRDLMVEPTRRLMNVFEEYGAKLTIMADVAEILRFKEYQEQQGRDDYHYEAIAQQLRDALVRGHDVQLHLHASYFNAREENGRWVQDWSEYNFAGLSLDRLNEIVRRGKQYLETLLQPVAPDYRCTVFRAANWAVSPSRNVVRALVKNGFRVESSVFKYGRREGLVNFDYSDAPSELIPWPVDEDNICRCHPDGELMEVPIYCERRWIGAFLSLNRLRRALMTRAHPIQGAAVEANGASSLGQRRTPAWRRKLKLVTQPQAWKADFNQCTGRQLIRAIQRAETKVARGEKRAIPFVLIGHSKQFSPANERSLRPFLEYVAVNKSRYRFATFTAGTAQVRAFDQETNNASASS